jgi:hypothetical protein
MSKKVEFVTYKDSEDKEKKIVVRKPKQKDFQDAKIYASGIFKRLYESGDVVLRSSVNEHLEKLGLWNKDKEDKLAKLNKEIVAAESKLKRGGIKLSEARTIAIDLKTKRRERTILLIATTELDSKTLEGQMENAEFDFLVSRAIYNEDGTLVFQSVDDYLESESDYIAEAAAKAANLIHNFDNEWELKLPENSFLLNHKWKTGKAFAVVEDKQLFLLDEDGNKILQKPENGESNSKEEETFVEFLEDE